MLSVYHQHGHGNFFALSFLVKPHGKAHDAAQIPRRTAVIRGARIRRRSPERFKDLIPSDFEIIRCSAPRLHARRRNQDRSRDQGRISRRKRYGYPATERVGDHERLSFHRRTLELRDRIGVFVHRHHAFQRRATEPVQIGRIPVELRKTPGYRIERMSVASPSVQEHDRDVILSAALAVIKTENSAPPEKRFQYLFPKDFSAERAHIASVLQYIPQKRTACENDDKARYTKNARSRRAQAFDTYYSVCGVCR